MTVRCVVLAIVGLFALLATPAHAEWWEAETDHFVVRSAGKADDARTYALEMEKFDAALRVMFGLPLNTVEASRANKPTIYRYGRPHDMARLIGAPGSGIAGFFISRAGNSVAYAPTRNERDTSAKTSWQIREDPRARMDPRTILLHEYAHYFMMQHFPAVYPRWYVEGFAELMATARFDDDGSVHLGDPPQYRAVQIFQLRDFPLDRMLDPEYKLTGLDGLQHYATGWLLAHYMSFNTQNQPKLRNYLVALANGENGLEAAKREFGDLSRLERDLQAYKKGPFPGRRIDSVNFSQNVSLRQLLGAEEDAIMLEMRINRGIGDEDEARDLARSLEAKLAGFPGNPHILALLAQAQYAARDYAASSQSAQQIVSADEHNARGWLMRALATAKLAKEKPELAETAREYATNAAQIDREDPRPMIAYYTTYLEAKEPAPEVAAIALEQAFKKAGTDPSYRLILARQLLVEGKLPSASVVLLPIAFQGHRTAEPKNEDDPSLSRLLKLVEEENRDAAIAMIDKMVDDKDKERDASRSESDRRESLDHGSNRIAWGRLKFRPGWTTTLS